MKFELTEEEREAVIAALYVAKTDAELWHEDESDDLAKELKTLDGAIRTLSQKGPNPRE